MKNPHNKYLISISFIGCEGLEDKVLDEIRKVIDYSTKALDHASHIKVRVTHEEATEQDMLR